MTGTSNKSAFIFIVLSDSLNNFFSFPSASIPILFPPPFPSLYSSIVFHPFPLPLFNTILRHSSFPLITFSLSLSLSPPPFSLWLTEGVQRHQSVCGWGTVCSGERAEAHRRPSSSCGEEAALSHGHRYPKPNYTGKTVLAN